MECIVWTLLFSLFLVLPLHAETRYVWDSCPTPQAPYTVWSNAAVNIQDAVDVSSPGDLIRVTNGTYSSAGAAAPGHTLTNRVCLTNGITVSSVNGPAVTSIQGAGPIGSDDSRRAAYVAPGVCCSVSPSPVDIRKIHRPRKLISAAAACCWMAA